MRRFEEQRGAKAKKPDPDRRLSHSSSRQVRNMICSVLDAAKRTYRIRPGLTGAAQMLFATVNKSQG